MLYELKKIASEEKTEHKELSEIHYDLYRDVWNIRPRFINYDELSVEDLKKEISYLDKKLEEQLEREREEEEEYGEKVKSVGLDPEDYPLDESLWGEDWRYPREEEEYYPEEELEVGYELSTREKAMEGLRGVGNPVWKGKVRGKGPRPRETRTWKSDRIPSQYERHGRTSEAMNNRMALTLRKIASIATSLDRKGLIVLADRLDKVLISLAASDPFGPEWRGKLWEEDPFNPEAHPNPEDYLRRVQRGDIDKGQPANPMYQKGYIEKYTLFEEDAKLLHNDLINDSIVSSSGDTGYVYTFPNRISVEIQRVPSSSLGTAPIPTDDFNKVRSRANRLMRADLKSFPSGGGSGGLTSKDELFKNLTRTHGGLGGGGHRTHIDLGSGFKISAIDQYETSREEFKNADQLEVAIISPNGILGYNDFKLAGFPWVDDFKFDQVAYIDTDEILKMVDWLKQNLDKLPTTPG